MLEGTQEDDVSNIHRRWSFTQLTPSSFKQSFIGSLICALAIALLTHYYYLQSDLATTAAHVALGLGLLAVVHLADFAALRGTPVNKLSKVAHVSFFANILWLLTVFLGVASDYVFSKADSGLNYLVAGMFLAAGLRVGIFSSVFGASIARAVLVSFIMPIVFLFAIVPPLLYPSLFSSYVGFVLGVVIYFLGVIWVLVADRAGRPIVPSTFGLLQAFLSAWTEKDPTRMEQFIEARALDEVVSTSVIRFSQIRDGTFAGALVLPDVHPGPFGTVGGSNLPFVLHRHYSNKALVMHSVSDHSLNIPSKREVDKYLKGVARMETQRRGDVCTQPLQVKIGKATTTGITFGSTAVVMLSLAPHGMEDIPQSVRADLETHAKSLGYSDILVVDCHNAMGKVLSDDDKSSLLSSARQCLEEMKGKPQMKFKAGISNMSDAGISLSSGELGQSGIAVLSLVVGDRYYALGWADSNNMHNDLREQIIAGIGGRISMLEVCTSDTHSTSGKRTKQGYFALGETGGVERISSAFKMVSEKAAERAQEFCAFEFGTWASHIRVMGKRQFEDYSDALDRSMNVTKIFVGITSAVYIAMLVLS